jgi:lipase maturation factor 1
LIMLSAGNFAGRIFGYDHVPLLVRRSIAATAPYHLTSNYGLFAVMTKQRPEIIIEGSDDGEAWQAYEFRWKPGDPERRPTFVQPHMPRLDWQMWFAALSTYRQNPWFAAFLERLLAASPPVLELLERDPFAGRPPRYVRAIVYDYHFTRRGIDDVSAWWKREPAQAYSPVLQRPAP